MIFARGLLLSLVLIPCGALFAEDSSPAGYDQVAAIFQKYCVACHDPDVKEGGLSLDSYAGLLRGGENGKVVNLGDPEKSRLLSMITGQAKPAMPPEGSERPTNEELALVTSWFKAGAPGPKNGEEVPAHLITPEIEPTASVRKPVNALATSPDGRWLAVGRHGQVEILAGWGQKPLTTLSGPTGHINDLAFSPDGKRLMAAAGEPGLFGEVTIWETETWKRERQFRGHSDHLYALTLSPDGKLLATGSYDQSIRLWDLQTGKTLKELTGHNGPVFDLAFHPKGTMLASASGDRTVKLWSVKTGQRLETFTEPEKAQYTAAFRHDGKVLAAGGVDNRIRVWRISNTGKAGTNRLLDTRFAHEAPILKLVFSPDDRRLISSSEDHTIKIWETESYTQLKTLKEQSDWVAALAVAPDNSRLFAGRLDGSMTKIPLKTGKSGGTSATPIEGEPLNPPATGKHHSAVAQRSEEEPNNSAEQAVALPIPGSAAGVLNPSSGQPEDTDFYRFSAQKGETWIIETNAAQSGSPADTAIDVFHLDGGPVRRLLLRAVRDSYITFRPIDSTQDKVRVKNWKEMELNQYMYLGGEVTKLYRMPQGPDSGFLFYKSRGKRRLYFDTSATIHAKGDPVYIVIPYAPGTDLIDNGLPVFPLDYSNDDDAERKLGTDSRLTFTAPKTGDYVVRVTDVRGFGGEDFHYSLTIRPPRPNFRVSLGGKNAKIPAGSGQRLNVNLERIDNFNGPVRVEIDNVPPGYQVTSPIVVEAGHLNAEGVIYAEPDAKPYDKCVWDKVHITATGEVQGKSVTQDVGDLGKIRLGPKPKVRVFLTTDPESDPGAGSDALSSNDSNELTLAPGETITAMLSIERNGFDGELKFDVDNLPHGVIVDNIGLSGVLIRRGENRRQIFLTAADWVPETTRLIHAVAKAAGNQASAPIVFHVKDAGQQD